MINSLRASALSLATALLLSAMPAFAQQANVNLDWNPQKNTQNLTPYGANVISPECSITAASANIALVIGLLRFENVRASASII